MVRIALKALGSASPAELSRFVEQQYGVRIEPKFIPLYKASIRDKVRLEAARQAARAVVEQPKGESPAAESISSNKS
jgi:hypothetical protein